MREAGELKRALEAAKGFNGTNSVAKRRKSRYNYPTSIFFRKMLTSFLLRFISFLFLDLNSPAKSTFFCMALNLAQKNFIFSGHRS